MPLPQWIWNPDRARGIAMANLILVEICLLAILVFRDATLLDNGVGDIVRSLVALGLLVLSFPLGWLGEIFFSGVHLPPIHAFVSLPLNAYLWGGLLELYFQHRAEARRVGLPPEKQGDQVDEGRKERSREA